MLIYLIEKSDFNIHIIAMFFICKKVIEVDSWNIIFVVNLYIFNDFFFLIIVCNINT